MLVLSNNLLSYPGMIFFFDNQIGHTINNVLSMTEDPKKEIKKNTSAGPVDDDSINNEGASNDHDDEFVSDLHQASSKDIAEADEAMKKLGLTKVQR